MSDSVRGLVVAHSSLAAGLVAAVRAITGVEEDVLRAISNQERGPEGLMAEVDRAAGNTPVIVFTDMGSGSCAFAARRIALRRPETAVVCGVNLPILLDFVFHRELPLDALIARLVDKGRSGISGACPSDEANVDRTAAG